MVRRVRTVGEAAVPDWVDRKNREFVYPFPEIPPSPSGGEGAGGAPTVVVAASNATDLSKSKADFICTGVSDESTIQQALDLIDTGTGLGGRVLLTEGTFNCAYGVIRTSDVTSLSPVHIQGLGDATCLNFSGGSGIAIDMNSEDSTLSNLWMLGNDQTGVVAVNVARHGIQIYSVKFERFDSGGAVISLSNQGDDCRIWGNFFDNNNSPCVSVATGAADGVIMGNVITTAANGIDLGGSNRFVIANNTIVAADTGIDMTGSDDTTIIGNHINFGSGFQGITGTGVHVVISGNRIEGPGLAVRNEGDQDWLITGNTFVSSNGVFCDVGANDTQINGNRFDTGGQILFDGGAFTGCQVSDNMWDIASTPSIDGVIRFDNGATDCVVTGNVIEDANGLNGIVIVSGTDCLIVDNFVALADLGILVSTGTRVTVRGNKVKWPGEHGIQYDGDFGTVSDNDVFGASQNTTNTWDNLNISGDGNLIQNNHSEPATVSPLTRYGLNITAGNDNAAYANQLGDSSVYGTADSIDSGTGTQTTPAAGAIGGQFAY